METWKGIAEETKVEVFVLFYQDPAISSQQAWGSYAPYDDGLALGIFINDSSGIKPIVGKVKTLGYFLL